MYAIIYLQLLLCKFKKLELSKERRVYFKDRKPKNLFVLNNSKGAT